MTRDAQIYITRQTHLAIRLAGIDAQSSPEELVDQALNDYLIEHHPTALVRVEAYQAAKSAAWKIAEKGISDEP